MKTEGDQILPSQNEIAYIHNSQFSQKSSVKAFFIKGVFKDFENSQENICDEVSFYNKVTGFQNASSVLVYSSLWKF